MAQNCRNKVEEEKGKIVFQNKFEMLSSRVIQYGVEERVIKRTKEIFTMTSKRKEQ